MFTLFLFAATMYMPESRPRAFNIGFAVSNPTSITLGGIASIVPAKPVIP